MNSIFDSSALLYVSPICVFAILGRVGCPQYMAPEVVSRRIYGKGCDVWGAGKKYMRIIELLQVMCACVCVGSPK